MCACKHTPITCKKHTQMSTHTHTHIWMPTPSPTACHQVITHIHSKAAQRCEIMNACLLEHPLVMTSPQPRQAHNPRSSFSHWLNSMWVLFFLFFFHLKDAIVRAAPRHQRELREDYWRTWYWMQHPDSKESWGKITEGPDTECSTQTPKRAEGRLLKDLTLNAAPRHQRELREDYWRTWHWMQNPDTKESWGKITEGPDTEGRLLKDLTLNAAPRHQRELREDYWRTWHWMQNPDTKESWGKITEGPDTECSTQTPKRAEGRLLKDLTLNAAPRH